MKRLLLAIAFVVGGCGMFSKPTVNAALLLRTEIQSGRYTKIEIPAYTSTSIHHLDLKLYNLTGGDVYTGVTRTLSQSQLSSVVALSNLKAGTTYRVRAYAYASAGESQLISTTDSGSYADFAVGSDDRPTVGTLKVKLIDRSFDGQATSSLAIIPGGYSVIGNEALGFAPVRVSTFAGSGVSGGQDGVGESAQFQPLYSTAVLNGKLYAVSHFDYRVREIDLATRQVQTLAGDYSNYGLQDGTGTAARFSYFYGITAYNGKLYVCDGGNRAIREIDPATKVVTTIAGGGGYGYQDGTSALFKKPHAVVGYNGKLYVTDMENYRIREIDLATKVVSTLAGDGTDGYLDGTGTNARFKSPSGITLFNGKLYVTDIANYRVREIDPVTKVVATIAGNGVSANADGVGTAAKFENPLGLVAYKGSLFVVDGDRIREIVLATKQVSTIAGSKQWICLGCPLHLTSDGCTNGHLEWFCTNGFGCTYPGEYCGECPPESYYQWVCADLVFHTSPDGCTNGSWRGGYRDGIGTNTLFDQPLGISADANGNLYVAEWNNSRIRRISLY